MRSPTPPNRSPRPFGAALMGSLLLVAACPASSPDAGAPGSSGTVQRPAMTRVGADSGPTEIELVQHLTPPRKVAPWVAKVKGESRTKRLPGGERRFALFIDSWGKRRVTIPGQFESDAFNRIALTGVFPSVFSITATLRGPDDVTFDTPRMATLNTREPQTILFELPRRRRRDVVLNELEFFFAKGGKRFEIHAVDLLRQPLALALPDPEGPGGVITIDDARHGFGVASGSPVTCAIEGAAGAILRFAYGIPPELRVPGQNVRLRVEIADEGQALERTYEVDSSVSDDPRWSPVNLPLDDFGAGAKLTLELEAGAGEALCAVSTPTVVRRGSAAPAILLVTSDTHRGDHLGSVAEGIEIETPALDALAERGVLFEDCYSSTNVTSPSHVALMTATHPRDTRLITNTAHLADSAETLAERFRAAGYSTLGVVSVRHLGPEGTGLGQGFDRMHAPVSGTWDAEVAVDHVETWLAANEGLPVFVWLHLFDAHHPYGPPEPYDRYYYPTDKDPFDDSLPPLELDPETIPEDLVDVRDLEFPKAQYRGEISYLDRELGRLFEHPRMAAGIVAVTADHGEVLEKAGSYFNHASLYPDTLHIPMILAWPGSPRGLRVEHSVEQIDLGRTLLDLADLGEVPFPGRNMVANLDAPPPAAPRFALSAHASSASVTLRPWHFVLYLREYKGKLAELRPKHSYELYHLGRDPECLENLAAEERDRVVRLREMLVEWLNSTEAQGLASAGQQSAEELEQLEALGYATKTEVQGDDAWIDVDCDCDYCAEFR